MFKNNKWYMDIGNHSECTKHHMDGNICVLCGWRKLRKCSEHKTQNKRSKRGYPYCEECVEDIIELYCKGEVVVVFTKHHRHDDDDELLGLGACALKSGMI